MDHYLYPGTRTTQHSGRVQLNSIGIFRTEYAGTALGQSAPIPFSRWESQPGSIHPFPIPLVVIGSYRRGRQRRKAQKKHLPLSPPSRNYLRRDRTLNLHLPYPSLFSAQSRTNISISRPRHVEWLFDLLFETEHEKKSFPP